MLYFYDALKNFQCTHFDYAVKEPSNSAVWIQERGQLNLIAPLDRFVRSEFAAYLNYHEECEKLNRHGENRALIELRPFIRSLREKMYTTEATRSLIDVLILEAVLELPNSRMRSEVAKIIGSLDINQLLILLNTHAAMKDSETYPWLMEHFYKSSADVSDYSTAIIMRDLIKKAFEYNRLDLLIDLEHKFDWLTRENLALCVRLMNKRPEQEQDPSFFAWLSKAKMKWVDDKAECSSYICDILKENSERKAYKP